MRVCGCTVPESPGPSQPCSVSVHYGCINTIEYNCGSCLFPACVRTAYRMEVEFNTKLKNMVSFFIDYKDLRVPVISQHASYTAINLFGELGGLIGLFIGCSLVTVAEMLDILLLCAIATVSQFGPGITHIISRIRRAPSLKGVKRDVSSGYAPLADAEESLSSSESDCEPC